MIKGKDTEMTAKPMLDTSYEDFVSSFIPLYSGPHVKVRIGSGDHHLEYVLSKGILCNQSPYFAAAFEGQQQSTTLHEKRGVVSQRSFKMLLQWMYCGRLVISEPTPKENITAIIEFMRIADLCAVTGMEAEMAGRIEAIIRANMAPSLSQDRDPNTNTYSLEGSHITSAALLPDGHPIRKLLATASVEGYIRCNRHKFFKEFRLAPAFAADLLMEVKETLKTVVCSSSTFKDPFTGKLLLFVTKDA